MGWTRQFALMCGLISVTGWAQTEQRLSVPIALTAHSKPLNQYSLRSWGTVEGLPHNSVHSIAQDSQGYLWLATWEGPVRFDGRQFTTFDDLDELGMTEVGTLSVTTDSTSDMIYFSGARGGITRFDGERWQPQQRVSGFIFQLATTADQSLWVAAANNGLIRFAANGERQVYNTSKGLPVDTAYRVYASPSVSGREPALWVGTISGLAKYDPQTDRFIQPDGLPATLVRSLFMHSSGVMLAGTDKGLFYQTEAGVPFRRWPGLDGPVTSVAEGPHGGIWFGTFTRGLGRINNQGISWLTTDDGLPNSQILAIFKDRESNMWVSTHTGLVQVRDSLFTSYAQIQGVRGNFVRSITEDKQGRIWVATNEGLSRQLEEQFEPLVDDLILRRSSAIALENGDDDILFVGTHNYGVLMLKDGQLIDQLDRERGLLLTEVRSLMYMADERRLLIGTPAGLAVADVTDSQLVLRSATATQDGLTDLTVTAMARVSADRAILTSTGGIFDITMHGEPDDWQISRLDISDFSPVQTAFAAVTSGERTYFAADRGLLIFEHQNERWHWFSRQHGLPVNKYFSLTFDRTGNVWLGSSRGVTRVSTESLENALLGHSDQLDTLHFTESDGLISSQINSGAPSSWRATDGRLWFASAQGAVVVDPEELVQHDVAPPHPVIEQALADGEAFSTAATLKNNTRRIEFHYAGLGYRMTAHIQYKIRLLGYDNDWIERGSLVAAQYTSLPPGDYRFEVRSRYPGGEWSEPAEWHFYKPPMFWQTTMFWVLASAVALALLYLIMVARTWQLRRQRLRLEVLVEEKTQELATMANEDALTGLANRRAFDNRLREETERARRHGTMLSVALLDIDHFKAINDEFMHNIGDAVLVQVADVLRKSVREFDYVARWGGEEFAILFPGADTAEAIEVCNRVRQRLRTHLFAELGDARSVTLSAGVARLGPDYDYSATLVRADQALYGAKQRGRDQVVEAPEQPDRHKDNG